MKEMIDKFMTGGGSVLVCPPCARVCGLTEDDLLEGVVVTGSGAMHELIKQGAATLSF